MIYVSNGIGCHHLTGLWSEFLDLKQFLSETQGRTHKKRAAAGCQIMLTLVVSTTRTLSSYWPQPTSQPWPDLRLWSSFGSLFPLNMTKQAEENRKRTEFPVYLWTTFELQEETAEPAEVAVLFTHDEAATVLTKTKKLKHDERQRVETANLLASCFFIISNDLLMSEQKYSNCSFLHWTALSCLL